MTFNNNPQRGSGANQPDKKQSIESDTSSVDWMIISDLSTRIGAYPEQKKEIKNSTTTVSSPQLGNNLSDDDLEDLEWLRSLGLDEPIEPPSSKINIASPSQNNDANADIDWLIVSDIKTKMGIPENAKPSSEYQDVNPSNKSSEISEEYNDLDNLLDEDLGLDGFDFDEDAAFDEDFDVLSSFGFDNSENISSNELQNDLDITEDKIQELSGVLGDSFDTNKPSSNDWDNDFGNLENTDSQVSSYSNLGIIEDDFEIPTQITGFADDINYSNESNDLNDYFGDDVALIPDPSPESAYQEDLQKDVLLEPLANDLLVSEILPDDLVEEFNIEGFDDELQNVNEFQEIDDYQDLPTIEEIAEVNGLLEEPNDLIDVPEQEWDEFQISESPNLDAFVGDEVWTTEENFEAEANNQTSDLQTNNLADAFDINDVNNIKNYEINDVFASDWEQNDQSPIVITDDAIWDNPTSIVAESISSTSIDNAFGTSDDWAIAPQLEQPAEPKIELTDSQPDVELESQIDNEANWHNDVNLSIAVDDDLEWNQGSELEINDPEELLFANTLTEKQNHVESDFGDIEQSSLWSKFNEPFAEEIADSDFADDFNNYENNDEIKPVEHINSDNSEKNKVTIPQDYENPENIADFDDLENIIDEDFKLDNFEEEVIPVSTTPWTNSLTSDITPLPLSVSDSKDNLVSPDLLTRDSFEEALTNDLQNDAFVNEYDLEVNLYEDALDNDLLNANIVDSELLNHISEGEDFLSVPPQIPPNLPLSESLDMNTNDRDFLDDFDLDSLDTHLTGDDFGAAFLPPVISSSGLTPPFPPIAPLPPSTNDQDVTSLDGNNLPLPPPFFPPLPPSANDQEVTTLDGNNPPLPPPFLPPLPPKRNPVQAKPPSGAPSIQNKPTNKPIDPIDDSWAELSDADTVLSGVLRPPTGGSSYAEPRESMPPPTAGRTGINAGNNAARPSQGKESDYNAFPQKTKDTGVPNFNDLVGLEIHDDWGGLLDSDDLSDMLTSINEKAQTSSPTRTPPLASQDEPTGINETRAIPRDRRKPISGFGATQTPMAAPPDQIDFNRFTEDNYGYELPAVQPEVTALVKKVPKVSMPSVSLESLWQDYLKIPVIGLGVIGGAFILYSLLNRPIFDIGLRWGIFKDASGRDFTNADFKGVKLDNVDFSKATLTSAKMQDASLVGANFTNANLDGVNFTNANLNRARLIKASVVWAEFNKAEMNLVDFEGADLTLSNFANAKMEGANLLKTKIGAQGTDKATKFSSTMLLAWQIVNEQREGRNLAEQDLSGLNLSFTSLKRANLSNAKLNYTDLTGTDLSGANLTGSQVNGANWSGAKLAGINLTDVNFDKNKLPKTNEETICPNGKKGPCKF